MRAKKLAAHYRAKAALMRARLRAINRTDLRTTVLGVAQTYESWAQEIEGAHNRETCARSQSGGGNGNVRLLGLSAIEARENDPKWNWRRQVVLRRRL
jgi:hypothetical protein